MPRQVSDLIPQTESTDVPTIVIVMAVLEGLQYASAIVYNLKAIAAGDPTAELSEISAKLDLVIKTLGEILDELRQLKYEVQEIVRNEITNLLNGQLSANIIRFNSKAANLKRREKLQEEIKTLSLIADEVIQNTLTLLAYRHGQGYGHWSGIGAGSVFYIAATKIVEAPKDEVDSNMASIRDWLKEAVNPDVENSLAAAAKSLGQKAADLKSKLEGERGLFLVAYTSTN